MPTCAPLLKLLAEWFGTRRAREALTRLATLLHFTELRGQYAQPTGFVLNGQLSREAVLSHFLPELRVCGRIAPIHGWKFWRPVGLDRDTSELCRESELFGEF